MRTRSSVLVIKCIRRYFWNPTQSVWFPRASTTAIRITGRRPWCGSCTWSRQTVAEYRILGTGTNADCRNYHFRMWTFIVQKLEPCTRFSVLFGTDANVSPSGIRYIGRWYSGRAAWTYDGQNRRDSARRVHCQDSVGIQIWWLKKFEEKPQLLTQPIVRHSPFKIRYALYGGRTGAMRLHN